jgi:hypothetical protein
LPATGIRLAPHERTTRFLARTVYKVMTDPSVLLRRLRSRGEAGGRKRGRARGKHDQLNLGLVPGEVVEIKSTDEIRATLDKHERCDGLAYMPAVMDRFCGGAYPVRRRVDRFFDERRGKLLRLRNVVILEGVYCEPPEDPTIAFAGCHRSCFLFWKEAWLRRI